MAGGGAGALRPRGRRGSRSRDPPLHPENGALREPRTAWREAWTTTEAVLPLTIAYVTFMHGVFFFGDPRYHAPLVPVFAILAAAGLRALWRRVRRDSTRASGTLTLY